MYTNRVLAQNSLEKVLQVKIGVLLCALDDAVAFICYRVVLVLAVARWFGRLLKVLHNFVSILGTVHRPSMSMSQLNSGAILLRIIFF